MDVEIQRLQAQIAETTKTLRAERNRLNTLERFEATTALQPVLSTPPTPRPSSTTGGRASAGSSRPGSSSAARKLPIEITAPMKAARDEMKTARDTTAALEKAKNRAAAQLEAALEDASRAEEKVGAAAAATNWGTENARHYRSPLQRQSAVAALQREIGDLHEAQLNLHAENQRLGHDLSSVSLQLVDYDELDWELYKTQADVKIHEDLLSSVEDEIRSIERIYAKKKALLAKTLATTNTDIVLALEADKKVEQVRLMKHRAASRDTAASTRHRAITIMQLEEKLKFYGDAIRTVLNVNNGGGDDDENGEAEEEQEDVPAEDIDMIRVQIANARQHDVDLQGQLEFLDAQVGNLEARVDILVRATMTLEQDEERESAGQGKRVANVQRSYTQQLQAADAMIATQRSTIEAKNAKLRQIRAKSEEQQQAKGDAATA